MSSSHTQKSQRNFHGVRFVDFNNNLLIFKSIRKCTFLLSLKLNLLVTKITYVKLKNPLIIFETCSWEDSDMNGI